jgi:peptide/nickel transport system substrate-binding protein
LLDSLAGDAYEGILDQQTVEQSGDDYGRNPVGTGPFIFKEWVTGDHITLERNPDFIWGPSFTGGTPPNIQAIIFRIIAETSTVIAGLEAGEIDYTGGDQLLPLDVVNLEATGDFDIIRTPQQGIFPYAVLNLSQSPFDDVRVRQALNYATDKQAIMDIVVPNVGAVIQNGPLSASQEGYWAGIEQMGYSFDLEKAKLLMLDAGYIYNTDGMLEKDGQPFSFEILSPNLDILTKTAEILQAQWKELGVDAQIVVQEFGVALADAQAGNYSVLMMAIGYPNSEMLTIMFHSKNIGGINLSQLNDPELDIILDNMANAVNSSDHMQAAQDAQIRVVEQAYVITLFSQVTSSLISKRVNAYSMDNFYGFRLWNAYIQQ